MRGYGDEQTLSWMTDAVRLGGVPEGWSGAFRTAAARLPDLGDTVATTLNIDDADPIRVYIAGAGETVDSRVADATSAYEQARIMAAFATWSAVADIQFVQTTNRAEADIEVLVGDTPPYGEAGYPGGGVQQMFMSNRVPQWTDAGALDEGGFGFLILIHEIGHLIGLTHTHDADLGAIVMPGVTSAFGDYGDNDLNQEVFSVMSYNRGWATGPLGNLPESVIPFGSPENPSAIDIIAVQRKYGVNTTAAAGDDFYVMQSLDRSYRTIWDTAGLDAIRHDGSTDAVIDLRAATLAFAAGGGGFVSHLAGFHGGFTIASGVVIENGIGGAGNDTLTGNATANTLFGRGGNDSILGGEGADTLNGNTDNDTLDGGTGADSLTGGYGDDWLIGSPDADFLDGSPGDSDTLDYSAAAGGVTVRLWNNSVSGDPLVSGDTIVNFENVEGGGGGDFIVGNLRANRLSGNGGNDTIIGSGENDTLEGGEGVDVLRGNAGMDVLIGGTGSDALTGGAEADHFVFATAGDAGIGAARDQIIDFEQGLDRIDVSGLSPDVFEFRGSAPFDPSGNPELRLFETPSGSTIVMFDLDGDGVTDAEIRVAGITGLQATDFLL
ncbi:M10 family metallopeptidase C-terminal domain-containing protein [Maliponia aquimaris]|uniref:Serralysin C n=1 Tax=Maliponia aquimaris TaxID=1673631 RepID=A0A238KHA2_9RHOB|nr:M10 family metallopeptidase C-terminal domain-containing protein [Maliponia aquimaris]SMX41974.1 Serralysin C precursor [Maliponia aquimaris]